MHYARGVAWAGDDRKAGQTGLLLSVLPLLHPMLCLLVSRDISGYHTCIELAVL